MKLHLLFPLLSAVRDSVGIWWRKETALAWFMESMLTATLSSVKHKQYCFLGEGKLLI